MSVTGSFTKPRVDVTGRVTLVPKVSRLFAGCCVWEVLKGHLQAGPHIFYPLLPLFRQTRRRPLSEQQAIAARKPEHVPLLSTGRLSGLLTTEVVVAGSASGFTDKL